MNNKINKLMLTVALCAAATPMATAAQYNMGEIEAGKRYDLSEYMLKMGVQGTFVAPSSGDLILDGGDFTLFNQPDGKDEVLTKTSQAFTNGGVFKYSGIEQGKTYYVYSGFVMNSTYLEISMVSDMALALQSANPAAGSVIDANINETGELYYVFNLEVTYDNAEILVDDKVAATISRTASDSGLPNTVYVNIQHAFQTLYANKVFNPDANTPFKLRINGLRSGDRLYNGDGVLEMDYVAAPKSLEFTYSVPAASGSVLGTLKSYMVPGTATYKFYFDGEINPKSHTRAMLEVGDPSLAGTSSIDEEVNTPYFYQTYNIPVEIEGNCITIDLAGKQRLIEAAATNENYVGLKIAPIYDMNGNLCMGNAPGTVGSISFIMMYEEIPQQQFAVEYTPAPGSELNDKVNVWITPNPSKNFKWDGAIFTYVDANGESKSAVVPQSDIVTISDINDANGGEMEFDVPVPAEVKNGKRIHFCMNNVETLDGYNHQETISAVYNSMVVNYITPVHNGETLDKIEKDSELYIRTNYDAKYPDMYVIYELIDVTDNEVVEGFQEMTREADGNGYRSMFYNHDVPLYKGHGYQLVFTAWENSDAANTDLSDRANILGSYPINLIGSSMPFEYSVVLFQGIDPEEGAEIEEGADFCFTVTFDGLVKLKDEAIVNAEARAVVKFEKVEAVDADPENEGFSSAWRLYPGNTLSEISKSVAVSFAAYDMDDKVIEGNMGQNADSFFLFEYVNISGTDSVETLLGDDTDGFRVYDVNGVLLLDSEKAEDLRALGKGLFIINGKKVILK